MSGAAQLTLAVRARPAPVTATVIGPELAIGISHVIDATPLACARSMAHLRREVAGRDDTRDLVLLRVPGLDVAPATPAYLPAIGGLLVSASRTWNGQLTSSLGMVGSVAGPIRTGRSGSVAQIL